MIRQAFAREPRTRGWDTTTWTERAAGDARSTVAAAGELREQGFYIRPVATHRLGLSTFLDGTVLESRCLFCPDWSACGTDTVCIREFARHRRTDEHVASCWRARPAASW